VYKVPTPYRTEDLAARVKSLTSGKGIDLVLNHVAGSTVVSSIDMLREWGTLCIYGAVGGPADGQIVQAQRAGFGKCARVQFFSMHGYESDPAGRKRILDAMWFTKLMSSTAARS
jgi:NADPH:quinone reductase-like Zn-dependent oxidoreductase